VQSAHLFYSDIEARLFVRRNDKDLSFLLTNSLCFIIARFTGMKFSVQLRVLGNFFFVFRLRGVATLDPGFEA